MRLRNGCNRVPQIETLRLEIGHFPQNSAAESNPEGWQRVAGGRSGKMGNDHRKGVGWSSTPERGARRELRVADPKTPGDLRLPSGNPPGWLPQNVQAPALSPKGTATLVRTGPAPPNRRPLCSLSQRSLHQSWRCLHQTPSCACSCWSCARKARWPGPPNRVNGLDGNLPETTP